MSTSSEAIAATYDFDGTIARTSEACPGGVDVDGAYVQAIVATLGEEAAQTYQQQGGNLSRTPAEILDSLCPNLPTGKFQRLRSDLVGIKLDILTGQIGTKLPSGELWPRPTLGFPESWQEVQEKRSSSKIVGTAIVSAGHDPFIAKWFDTYNLPLPDASLTVEITDDLLGQFAPHELAKPSPLLMQIALSLLRRQYPVAFTRIVHHGDSEEKDGQFAAKSHAQYLHIAPETSQDTWKQSTDILLDR